MKSKKRIFKRILIGLVVMIIALFGALLIYSSDYYHASDDVTKIMNDYEGEIEKKSGYTIVFPRLLDDRKVGLVFYPGAKVEAKAYIPLLIDLADHGVTSVLVEMPFNLAVFNINAANHAIGLVDGIDSWYLAGHSLGGAMASSYMKKNSSKFDGLVLLAAYPINDAPIPTIQIYGSNDGVLDQTKIVKDVLTYVIKGENHAYFGNYGEQKGDGDALITRISQQQTTAIRILEFMGLVMTTGE